MGFAPDFGLRYLEAGHGGKTLVLRRIRVQDLVQIGPRLLTCTVNISMERVYAASLDFADHVVDELLALSPDTGDSLKKQIAAFVADPRPIPLRSLHVDLEARLGGLEVNAREPYVPLLVERVSPPSAAASIEVR